MYMRHGFQISSAAPLESHITITLHNTLMFAATTDVFF